MAYHPQTKKRKGLFGATTIITREKTPTGKKVTKVRTRKIGPKAAPRIKTVTVVRTKEVTPKGKIVKFATSAKQKRKDQVGVTPISKRIGKKVKRTRTREVTRTAIPVFPRF